jgi:uncharacterized protein (DUF488 family)
MTEKLYTVGHSNRLLEDLVAIVRAAGIMTLVDVRQHPQSQRHPQFGEDSLRAALAASGIEYHWAGRQLGGHRQPQPESRHRALQTEGMRAYADYMDTDAFKRGAAQLMGLARRAPTAILCAERDPLHCHRSLIADYLILQGVDVVHLLEQAESQPHQLRPEARRESQQLVYDRFATAELPLA